MTYYDLLNRDEWRAKRKLIIQRDSNRCSKCGNLRLVENLYMGFYTKEFDDLEDRFFSRFVDVDKKRFSIIKDYGRLKDYGSVIFYYEDVDSRIRHRLKLIRLATENEKVEYWKRVGTFETTLLENLKAQIKAGVVSKDDAARKLIAGLYDELPNLSKIEFTSTDFQELAWVYSEGLNVHHTYYDNQLNPWEYPDDSLMTLCEKCHKEHHGFQLTQNNID